MADKIAAFKFKLLSKQEEKPNKRRKLDNEKVANDFFLMNDRPKRNLKQTKFFDNSDTILKGSAEARTPETKVSNEDERPRKKATATPTPKVKKLSNDAPESYQTVVERLILEPIISYDRLHILSADNACYKVLLRSKDLK